MVAENAPVGTIVGTMAATDVDTVGSLQGWAISAGNSDGMFAIDSATGEITIADSTKLDYEAATSHVLNLSVSDGVNSSAGEIATVQVADSDEFDVDAVSDADGSGQPSERKRSERHGAGDHRFGHR